MRRTTARVYVVFASMVLISAVFASTPAVSGDDRQDCDTGRRVIAVYDCDSGLVLWSRTHDRDVPPTFASDRALCRLVVGPDRNHDADDACL